MCIKACTHLLYVGEYISCCLENDARVMSFFSHHGVCLTTSCLAIGKDGAYRKKSWKVPLCIRTVEIHNQAKLQWNFNFFST